MHMHTYRWWASGHACTRVEMTRDPRLPLPSGTLHRHTRVVVDASGVWAALQGGGGLAPAGSRWDQRTSRAVKVYHCISMTRQGAGTRKEGREAWRSWFVDLVDGWVWRVAVGWVGGSITN